MVDVTAIAVGLLHSAILGLFVLAIRHRNIPAAINALGAFVLALLPVLGEIVLDAVLSQDVVVGPVLPGWIAAAGVLHSLGMLGLYESIGWWDHLTHTVSAALVAAILYAGMIVTLPHSPGSNHGLGTVMAMTLGLTFAIGVFWELIELLAREVGERVDIEPVLVHYGWRDTVVDLGFDVVGSLLVLGADLRIFVPLLEQFPGVTASVLVGSGWSVFVGSVSIAVLLGLASSRRS